MLDDLITCPVCLVILLGAAILLVIAAVVELWIAGYEKNDRPRCPRCGSHWHTDCNEP